MTTLTVEAGGRGFGAAAFAPDGSTGLPGSRAKACSRAANGAIVGGGAVRATIPRCEAAAGGRVFAAPEATTLARVGATGANVVAGAFAIVPGATATAACATGRDCANAVAGTAVIALGRR